MTDREVPAAACKCASTALDIKAPPLLQAFCHCTICQAFNDAPFADIVVYRAADVVLRDSSSVEYRRLKAPPAVDRGKCMHCGQPAVEWFKFPLMPDLAMVPRAMFKASLPGAQMHLFYHRRIADIDDRLPKYNGYLSSQLAFMRRLFTGLRLSSSS